MPSHNPKTATKSSVPHKGTKISQPETVLKAEKAAFPKTVQPMLATLVDNAFDEEGWMYEVKWDGYRAVALLNNGKVELSSRNTKSFNDKFYPIYNELKKLKINAVLDGEIIVADDNGLSHFENLQGWRSEADGNLKYYVFDLIWLNGLSVTMLPLEERRRLLRTILPVKNAFIHLSENFNAKGTDFFTLADKMGLEGIIAKKAGSKYYPGIRSKDWLKIKNCQKAGGCHRRIYKK